MIDIERARSIERLIVRARWVGVAFAALQVTLYAEPYPPGYQAIAYGIVALLAAANIVIMLANRRSSTLAEVQQLSILALGVDVVFASAIVWLYAFDPTSALFAILFVLPVEGAVRFELRGAMWTWGVVAAAYTARELWAGGVHGHAIHVESITFRMGLVGIVAYIVGGMARNLNDALRTTEAMERWRSDLISVLAHDVRAPLATAISSLELLRQRRDRLPPETYERIIEGAGNSLHNVERLARDLLDMARVETGKLAILTEPTEVVGLVRASVRSALGANFEYVTFEGATELVADVDPHRFEQIVTNLVTNALRHGEPPVTIRMESADGDLLVEVTDQGPGVADVELGQLFQRFSSPGRQGSVGLGLWIVWQLVEAHGGTVTYQRRDEVSCFWVTIPGAVARAHESAAGTST